MPAAKFHRRHILADWGITRPPLLLIKEIRSFPHWNEKKKETRWTSTNQRAVFSVNYAAIALLRSLLKHFWTITVKKYVIYILILKYIVALSYLLQICYDYWNIILFCGTNQAWFQCSLLFAHYSFLFNYSAHKYIL